MVIILSTCSKTQSKLKILTWQNWFIVNVDRNVFFMYGLTNNSDKLGLFILVLGNTQDEVFKEMSSDWILQTCMFTLVSVLEEAWEFIQPVHMCFVSLKESFEGCFWNMELMVCFYNLCSLLAKTRLSWFSWTQRPSGVINQWHVL